MDIRSKLILSSAFAFGLLGGCKADEKVPHIVVDAGPDADTDAGPDADTVDPLAFSMALENAAFATASLPDAPTFGFASDVNAFGGAGTSWRYQKTSTDLSADKFELYIPFTFEEGSAKAPVSSWDGLREHLGEITLGDIDSIEVHSRRGMAASQDLTMLVFTTPTGTDDDASWFHNRLHAEFRLAGDLNAPVGQWNRFSTEAGENQLRFWDYRAGNVNNGLQPLAGEGYTLAELQAGEIVPVRDPAVAAREYSAQKIKYITFMTLSGATDVDVAIDGITITLKDGRHATIDLAGASTPVDVLNAELSFATLSADWPPSAGSSFGTFEDGGLRYVKTPGTSPASEKFELHLPFTVESGAAEPNALWDAIRAHVGAFTVDEIESFSFRTRRNDATTADFSLLVYTTPIDGVTGDNTWYNRRLHCELTDSLPLVAPANTWNTYSTASGNNELHFWDYRHRNQASWIYPELGESKFTLTQMQDGPITIAANAETRDYGAETVKFITLSTYTNYAAFDASVMGFELRLKNGRTLVLHLVP